MGVQNLWKLLAPIGKRISIETLGTHRLAIDVSIWLEQFAKAMVDSDGVALQNGHIIAMLRRICTLLFHNIRPVFVFDGARPNIKRRTLAQRQRIKRNANDTIKRNAEKILLQQLRIARLQAKVPKKPTEHKQEVVDISSDISSNSNIYALEELSDMEKSESEEIDEIGGYVHLSAEEMAKLPISVQYEVMQRKRQNDKYHNRVLFAQASKGEPEEFSSLQLNKFLAGSNFNQKINDIRSKMQASSSRLGYSTYRIAADGKREYIYEKTTKKKEPVMSQGGFMIEDENHNNSQPIYGNKEVEDDGDDDDDEDSLINLTESQYSIPDSQAQTLSLHDNDPFHHHMISTSSQSWICKSCATLNIHSPVHNSNCSGCGKAGIQNVKPSPKKVVQYKPTVTTTVPLKPYIKKTEEPATKIIPLHVNDFMSDASDESDNIFGGAFDSDSENSSNEEEEKQPQQQQQQQSTSSRQYQDLTISEIEQPVVIPEQKKKNISKPIVISDTNRQENEVLTREQSLIFESPPMNITDADECLSDVESSEKEEKEDEEIQQQEIQQRIEDMKNEEPIIVETETVGEKEHEKNDNIISISEGKEEKFIEYYPNRDRLVGNHTEEVQEAQEEISRLESEKRRYAQQASGATDSMRDDVISLLQLFGIPYMIAEAEAEAQCAQLELAGLVDGIVTNDSDVFLFGGKHIYRNLFDQKRFLEMYHADDFKTKLGLDRNDLICMAMLLGSDYTAGVKGIGIVNSMEIIQAFPGVDGLSEFREWVYSSSVEEKPSKPLENDLLEENKNTEYIRTLFKYQHRNIRSSWDMHLDFPSLDVIQAYQKPQVIESDEQFSWSQPDVPKIKEFLQSKLIWSEDMITRTLQGVVTSMQNNNPQTRLERYFNTQATSRIADITSERIQAVVNDLGKGGRKRKRTTQQEEKDNE